MIVNYEYGSAIEDADGTVWDEEFFTREPVTKEQLAKWNAEHTIGNDGGSIVIAVRRPVPDLEVYQPER